MADNPAAISQLSQVVRQLRSKQTELVERLNLQGASLQKLSGFMKEFGRPGAVLDRLETLENCKLNFKERQIRDAAWLIPHFYVGEQPVPATTARVPVQFTISQWGWFFLERLYVCFRPTAAGAVNNVGRWRPVSGGNAVIASGDQVALAGGGTRIQDVFNFYVDIKEGRADRDRQNLPFPGDILYRGDGDGFMPWSDGFGPAATVTVGITPTVAPDNAGIVSVVLTGLQCLDANSG